MTRIKSIKDITKEIIKEDKRNVVSDEFKKKFNYLFEYKISSPKSYEEYEMDDEYQTIKEQENQEKEEDINTSTDEIIPDKNVEFEDTNSIEQIENEELDSGLVKLSDIDRVKSIQDMQTKKLEELENYLNVLKQKSDDTEIKLSDLDNVKINLDNLKDHVKEITPPTPEESLDKMAEITGGVTITDYWKDYINKHQPLKQVENEKEEKPYDKSVYISDVTRDQGFDERSIKDSLM